MKAIAVYVGTAQQVIIQLGAFSQDKTYEGLDAKGLINAVIANNSSTSGGTFSSVTSLTINNQEAVEATFSFKSSSSTNNSFDGVLLIVKLSSTKFAALIGAVTPGQTKTIQPITRAVAATIKVTP